MTDRESKAKELGELVKKAGKNYAEGAGWGSAMYDHKRLPTFLEAVDKLVLLASKEHAEAAQEPVAEPALWQWRRKGDPWSLEFTFNTPCIATTEDSEVRPLYASTPSAPQEPAPQGDAEDAARYRWLRDHWIEVRACPARGGMTGVRVLGEDDDGIGEGGERLDAAIDAARSGAKP